MPKSDPHRRSGRKPNNPAAASAALTVRTHRQVHALTEKVSTHDFAAAQKDFAKLHPDSPAMANLMSSANHTKHLDINDRIEILPKLRSMAIDALLDQVDALNHLQMAGMIEASIYMKDGRYPYFDLPTTNGSKRRRTYIGVKPGALEEAEAKIERFKQYRQRIQHVQKINQQFTRIDNLLHQLELELLAIPHIKQDEP